MRYLLALFSLLLLIAILSLLYKSPNTSNPIFTSPKFSSPIPNQPSLSTPTLNQIFAKDHSFVSTASGKLRTIIATGDIIPARSVNYQVHSRNNFLWPYEQTYSFVKDADLTFVNLETPLLRDCPLTQEGMVFCGDKRNVEGLVYAGVDIASLANNHAANHGELGVAETKQLLEQNGIAVTGINGPKIMDIKGLKFAFLGYNDITKPQPGVSDFDEQKMQSEILAAKKLADVVIVTFHWGVEYRDTPDDRQIYIGHLAIDDGADLVIGNHPHWIQPVEIYKNKLITYAHGNFVFDQMWSEKTRQGVVGRYTFQDKNLIDVEYFPVQIDDYGQPHFMSDPLKTKILDEMHQKSRDLINK